MAEKEIKNVPADAEKADKATAKAKKNNGKPGFFQRLGAWFKGLKSEFKKITWASRKSTFKNFGIVLVIVIATATVIGVVDFGLGSFFNLLHRVINV